MTFDLNNSLWLNLEFCFHNKRPFYREEIDENIFENLKLATSPKNLVLGFYKISKWGIYVGFCGWNHLEPTRPEIFQFINLFF